jgi:hypothetical protein
MPRTLPGYDGLADWHDRYNEPNAARNAPEVLGLLGAAAANAGERRWPIASARTWPPPAGSEVLR